MKIIFFTIILGLIHTDEFDNIHSVIDQIEKDGRRNLKAKKLDDMELDIFNSTVDKDQLASYDNDHVKNAMQIAEEQEEVIQNTISQYPHIMMIGERTNKYYNYHKKIIDKPVIQNLIEEQHHYNEQYQQTREMLLSIVQNSDVLIDEMNKFLKNIHELELTSEDLVKFFGFEEFFNDIKSKIKTDDLTYDENARNLDLFTNTITEDVVNFFQDIFKIANIGSTLKSLASSKREITGKDNQQQYEKIDASIELVKGVLKLKKDLTNYLNSIEEVMEKNFFLRLQLKKQLVSFEDREKAEKLEEEIQKEENEASQGLKGEEDEDDKDEQNVKYSIISRIIITTLIFIL